MLYETKNFEHFLKLSQFSQALLKNHLTLYQGYVTNLNKLLDLRGQLIANDKMTELEFAEITRRLAWEWNGMRLHELYFENLNPETKELDKNSSLFLALEKYFGSFTNWKTEFINLGAMRGIGWVILVRDNLTGQLFNVWINEHDTGHLAGTTPLLIMDVFEHAYMLDFGLKRTDYLQTFMTMIDWSVVAKR